MHILEKLCKRFRSNGGLRQFRLFQWLILADGETGDTLSLQVYLFTSILMVVFQPVPLPFPPLVLEENLSL